MRSNGSTCRAIIVGGAVLLVLILLALGSLIGYFTSSNHTRNVTSAANNIKHDKLNEVKEDVEETQSEPSVEYVTPIKKHPLPTHRMEIIYPHEIYLKGNDTHHSGHFRGRNAEIWDPHPQYEFAGFGRKFHLDLAQRDSDFVIPNIKVTHIWENSTVTKQPNLSVKGCFYAGTVRGDPGSLVSVNLCHGMTGHIRTSTGSFLIEPVESWRGYDVPLKHSLRRVTSAMVHDNCHGHNHGHHIHQPSPHRNVNNNEVDDYLDDEENLESEENIKKNRRRKRFVTASSEEYFIEIMIVVDKNMLEYHGDNLTSYILTLMSIVSSVFKDATIGNSISIAVVKISALEHQSIILGSQNYSDASSMLSRFCNWQYKKNVLDDNSPHHYDTAILLTRENLCPGVHPSECTTLGLAQTGTICNPERSCSLASDRGLETAFTIAHELGHILNMPHDDEQNCTRKSHYVMSSKLKLANNPWTWSSCSRHFLTEFLYAGDGFCMLDHPIRQEKRRYPEALPGEEFDADRQCQLIYGPMSKMCPIMPECDQLWCAVGVGCNSQNLPWADGTPCTGGWCQRGVCVRKDRSALKPVNGSWGSWQRYGECSRTCGGGVKTSERFCNNPPPSNGGQYCLGRRIRIRSCATQECPTGSIDFRVQQCAKFNNNNFNLKGLPENVKWVPKYEGIEAEDRCKLYCRVEGSSPYYPLSDQVIDGTVCGLNSYDICVKGVCKPAGCDHVLGSTKVLDYCGQCNGNNSTCQRTSGSYNETRFGYSNVVKIPAGSSNIDIRQIALGVDSNKDDNHFLALVDGETNQYILNGNSVISLFSRRFLYNGTILDYSGSSESVERINSSRPLTKKLIVQVLSIRGRDITPPNIMYEFSVRKQKYKWEISENWTTCDKLCHGVTSQVLKCFGAEDRVEVSPEMCDINSKPKVEKKMCNTFCELRWEVTGKSTCSKVCGFGERTISLQCIMEDNLSGRITYMDNSSCNEIPRPPTVERCRSPCENARWIYGPWSSCSVTCGEGIETRTAECIDHSGIRKSDLECNKNEKEVQRSCQLKHCPVWHVGEWSPCSVSCGKGVQERPFRCMVGDRVDNSQCSQPMPEFTRPCEVKACPIWISGPWSACSVSCGSGKKTRSVTCSEGNNCSPANKPSTAELCNVKCSDRHINAVPDDENGHYSEKHNRYIWNTAVSSCSVTCGRGIRRRYNTCFDTHKRQNVRESYCLESYGGIYETKEECEVQIPCPENKYYGDIGLIGKWNISEWEPCSAICGTGFKKRSVSCQGLNGNYVPDSFCKDRKPINETECETPCYRNRWVTSPWSECSEPCGGGIRTRTVHCDYSVCKDKRPETKEQCNLHSCIEGIWHYGAWSGCNVSCGTGYRQRKAYCRSPSGGALPERACKDKRLDAKLEVCYGNKCGTMQEPRSPRWRTSRWSACSSQCTQSRMVWCESSTGPEPSKSDCSGKRMPKSIKPCKKKCLPNTSLRKTPYYWKRGPWSQCLAANGFQTRTVSCVHLKGHQEITVDESHCKQERPSSRQSCLQKNVYWKVGEWKPCNKPCSKKGREERKIHCYSGDREVARSHCNRLLLVKPVKKRRCAPIVCTSCRERQIGLQERINNEYPLFVRGVNISIYCHGMNTEFPQEYITLNSERNYAMFYDKSIREPQNGENCQWEECGSKKGYTVFKKIAINVTSLTVNREDWTFAETWKGSDIKYGEAGDCIANTEKNKNCPVQGEFVIDLHGTGLRVHPSSVWDNFGTGIFIDRSHNDVRIIGRCGGGFCRPRDPLRLDLAPP